MVLDDNIVFANHQWRSPRGRPWSRGRPCGQILKSLALASKAKSLLASKSQVLENCPIFGLRTALFFEWLKLCRSAENFFLDRFFFFEDRLKHFFEDLFFLRMLACVSLVLGLEHSCPWPREGLSSEGLSLALV